MISSWLRFRKILPDAIVIAIVMLIRVSGGLQFPELSALDTLLRLRPAEPADDRIVIVGITEADIQQAKTYPLPDQTIANLIAQLNTYQPAVIGLDIFRDLPVEPGHGALVKTFQTTPNLIVVNKALPDRSGQIVNPPPSIPLEQVGFADALLDGDGKLRRSLLATATNQGDRLSLSLRLAAAYLKPQGIELENGIRDPDAIQFGTVELPYLQPNSGGYVRTDAGGNQLLINFRNGAQPFPVLTLQDLQKGVDPARLRGKIVLIGVMAPSVKDIVNTSAIAAQNSTLIYGVEAQAHVVSGIVSGVLDGRPLLTVWSNGWEYLWIIAWGVLGIGLGRFLRSPLHSFLALTIAAGCLVLISYGVLLLGWWIPLVPALLALTLNGLGLAAFHRYDDALRSRLRDRQITIDQTFNAIHNGPLQTLAQILRTMQQEESQSQLLNDLHRLNQELRQVYDVVRQEALLPDNPLYLGERELSLHIPLHELLQEVYSATLERDLPGFKTIKVKVVNLEPLDDRTLNADQKRGLCRFLEEALCNVGKHAIAPTRLDILSTQSGGQNILRITDNGKAHSLPVTLPAAPEGMGTHQAKQLARQLGGRFQRLPHTPQGMICELTWSGKPRWWHGWT